MGKDRKILHGLSLKILTVLTVITLFCGLFTLFVNQGKNVAAAEKTEYAVEYVIGDSTVTAASGATVTYGQYPTPTRYRYKSHVAGLNAAISKARELNNGGMRVKDVKVILASDWVAQDMVIKKDATTGAETRAVAFGADGNGFASGLIVIRYNSNITLDLAGYKIDRNLQNPTALGYVMQVTSGSKLVITDSSQGKTGQITGGYNKSGAYGCIENKAGGTLILESGKITGNKVSYSTCFGAGVFNAGTFTMNGGEISNNEADNSSATAQGIGIHNTGTLTINGGEVSHNTVKKANLARGVGIYNKGGTLKINGGSISNNSIVSAANAHGVGVVSDKTFEMTGGEISNNSGVAGAQVFGGGVAILGGTFEMSGGEISNNKVTSYTAGGVIKGGGILVDQASATLRGTAKIADNEARLYVNTSSATSSCHGGGILMLSSSSRLYISEGAEISGNKALRYDKDNNVSFGDTHGGGIFTGSAASLVEMTGGKIINNYAFQSGAIEVNGTFNFYGGEISNNRAIRMGAMYLIAYSSGGRMNIKGNPIVKDNFAYTELKGEAVPEKSGVALTDSENNPILYNGESFEGKAAYRSNMFFYAGYLGDYKMDPAQEDLPPYTLVTVGNKQLADFPNYHVKIVGKLTQGADLHFIAGYSANNAMKSESEFFAWNYSEYNYTEKTVGGLTYKVPVDPNTYFHSDRGETSKIVLTDRGTLVETTKDISLYAKHAPNGDTEEQIKQNGYSFETTYDENSKLFATIKNGENSLEGKFVNAKGEELTADLVNAGVYCYNATVSTGFAVQYTLVVMPKELTSENTTRTIAEEGTHFYNTKKKEPSIAIKHGEVSLAQDTHYNAPVYGDNVNAGDGTITVTFKGNYYGTVTYTFVIAEVSANYTVAWQYLNSENRWITFRAEEEIFKYSTTDYSLKVRAALTVTGVGETAITEYVYAPQTGDNIDEERKNKTNMHLTFVGTFETQEVNSLLNATEYTATISGSPNFSFAQDSDREIKLNIGAKKLDISAASFKDYNGEGTESSSKVLWLEKLSDDSARLIDKAIYFDPDAEVNPKYNAKVVEGQLFNSYVRYNGVAHLIELNLDYGLGGKTLNDYMSSFKGLPVYESKVDGTIQTSGVTGRNDKVTKVITTVKLTLNANWAVEEGGSNVITIEKEWYIVNINNRLLDTMNREVTTFNGWTFGDTFNGVPFRPEHGKVVIYALSDETTVRSRWAVEFEGSAPYFYEVKVVEQKARANETYVINKEKEITNRNYYIDLMNGLEAGFYTLNAAVDIYEVDDTIYYPISLNFDFKVEKFAIRDNAENSGLNVTYGNSAAYNGVANNLPSIIVKFKDTRLQKDIDYKVESENVNVGDASFKVIGLGNFAGEVLFENSYKIVKATNTWKYSPSVVSWVFSTYEPRVNTMSATPNLLDAGQKVWYKVTSDKEGANPLEGLEKFELQDDGYVPEGVSAAFNSLESGKYYLHATIDGNDNYTVLTNGVEFNVFIANNEWQVIPDIISWEYNAYNKDTNLVIAKSRFGEISFTVATDAKGENAVEGLRSFGAPNGIVPEEIATLFANLTPNTYYLVCSVANTSFYSALNDSVEFKVEVSSNNWKKTPEVIAWNYNSYNLRTHRILATAVYGNVTFAVATDDKGENLVEGLENFTVNAEGLVSSAVADKLNGLKTGRYYLLSTVAESSTYKGLATAALGFNVSKANNEWLSGSDELSLPSWVVGRYSAETTPIVIKARYGEVNVVIEDVDGTVYYSSLTGENKLNDCKVGKYLLKAWVNPGDDFNELTERTFTIEVLKKIGLPWWGTMSITLGALALAALIIFILWKRGVFQILTAKLVVAIRTRASIDATIASVRAAMKTEAGKRTVAEAERRDAEEKAKAEESKNSENK